MSEDAASKAKNAEREKLKAERSWYSGADLRWHMRDFKQSFCAGMSRAIQERLIDRRRAMEAEMQTLKTESNALIHLRNTAEAIAAFLEDKFRDHKPSRARPNIAGEVRHREAFRAGEKAGKQVALTSGALTG